MACIRRSIGISVLFVVVSATSVVAQTGRISGFVTDASNGRPLELATVVLTRDPDVVKGVVTNKDGLFLIPRLEAGTYRLSVKFIGYQEFVDTLALATGQSLNVDVALAVDEEALGEVVVQSDRIAGGARVIAGQQTIRPGDIELIPTPDVSGDLASYLTSIPGVVTLGDRGGQLFIRGGEPAQNLVQVDGIVLYQPFHLLGFYSAFPSEIINRADVYAGGYGSKFGERLSSVIDVSTRNGNNQTYGGAAAISPFMGMLRVEGPIIPNKSSVLVVARQSMVEQAAERVIDRSLPYSFGDVFANLHTPVTGTSRLYASFIHTYDRGTLGEATGGIPDEEVRWKNTGYSFRYLLLPSTLPVVAEAMVSHSYLNSELGPTEKPLRFSKVKNTDVKLDATFTNERVNINTGLALRFMWLNSELGGLFQNFTRKASVLIYNGMYLEPDIDAGRGFRIRPGLRMQFFKIRLDPYLEPRIRFTWDGNIHHVSSAFGIYHQEVVGLTDRRDAASIFTVWTNVPKEGSGLVDVTAGRMGRAFHSILGYRMTPGKGLELSVEGFHRLMSNLFISEWSAFPQFTTRLQPADGRSYGFDARVELRAAPFYGLVNYGYSNTMYEAKQAAIKIWYGVETMRFRPPHDRRHRVNALVAVTALGCDFSARWEFGSGLPFSQAIGFDGFAIIDDLQDVTQVPWTRRVIYEQPYRGELPTYHRLDLAVERTFKIGRADLTAQASVMNVYDRRNLYYLDVFTLRRADQLPLVPSLGIKVAFDR